MSSINNVEDDWTQTQTYNLLRLWWWFYIRLNASVIFAVGWSFSPMKNVWETKQKMMIIYFYFHYFENDFFVKFFLKNDNYLSGSIWLPDAFPQNDY